MPESKNITIAVGGNHGKYEGSKMMPLIQDYPDYIAEYNIGDSDSDFFTTILNKSDSNIYAFFKSNVSFQESEGLIKIAKAFAKDLNVAAVVCDGYRTKNKTKHPYYLDTNHLTNLDVNIPIFFHKNIIKSTPFRENPYQKLIEVLNVCLSQQKLIIHIAEPLIVINE